MAIELVPRVGQDPVRSQTGGLNGRVEPMREPSTGSLLAVGSGMQDLGRAVTVAADRWQDQVDVAQSRHMRNLYDVEVENEFLAPESGFLTTEGMDANKERRKQSFDRLKEKRKSIEALGQNDMQRLNFAEHADRADAESNLRADVHQDREVKHFLAGETKVSAALGIKRGIKLHGTDEGDIAVLGAMQDLDKLADLYGWPEDSKLRANQKQEAMDLLHSGIIDNMLSSRNARGASDYLKQHRSEMSDDKAADAGRLVSKGVIDDTSTRLAMAITAAHEQSGPTVQPTEDQPVVGVEVVPRRGPPAVPLRAFAQKGLDEMFRQGSIDAKLRDATMDRIKAQEKDRQEVEDQQTVGALTRAEAWVFDNPGKPISMMPTQLHTPLAQAGKLPEIASVARANGNPETDAGTFAEMQTWKDNPDALRQLSPVQITKMFFGRASREDINSLMASRAVAIGNASKSEAVSDDEEKVIVEGFYRATGKSRSTKPTDLGDLDKARLYQYRAYVVKRRNAAPKDMPIQDLVDGINKDRVSLDRSFVVGDLTKKGVYNPLKPTLQGGAFAPLMTDAERREAFVNVGGEQIFIGEVPSTPQPVPGAPADTLDQTAIDEKTSVRQEIMAFLNRTSTPYYAQTEEQVATIWAEALKPKTVDAWRIVQDRLDKAQQKEAAAREARMKARRVR